LDAAKLLIERAARVTDQGTISPVLVARNARDASLAAALVLGAVDRLFRMSGSQVHFQQSHLQRFWRDIQTLTTHIALRPDLSFSTYTRSVWAARVNSCPVAHAAPAHEPVNG
jgi:dihydrophenazinedicarboxylate synthase